MAIFQTPFGDNKASDTAAKKPSTTRKVLKYSLLPEILPRIRAIGFHFGHFAYLLALVFASARLIPHSHPVMNAANMGRFGIRQVIAIAANNLTWDRKHIDQVGIFIAIVMGLVVIILQTGIICLMTIFGNDAQAASYFQTPNASEDHAFRFLAQVFGDLDGFWSDGTNVANAPGAKTAMHDALHAMLALYSNAIMVIAVIIVLYYIITVVGEAAKTGTPFGQRFNSLWAPIRLVVALGLLVPLTSGLNSAQYITLWTAKMASGLGSQVWQLLANEIKTAPENTQYILEDFDTIWALQLTRMMFISEVCKESVNRHNLGGSGPLISRLPQEMSNDEVFRHRWSYVADDQQANAPDCGSVEISMQKQEDVDRTANSTTANLANQQVVPVEELYNASVQMVESIATATQDIASDYAEYAINRGGAGTTNPLTNIGETLKGIADTNAEQLKTRVQNVYANQVKVRFEKILDDNVDQGWITAGLWYIKIGQLIQSVQTPMKEMVPIPEMPDEIIQAAEAGNIISRNFGSMTEVYNAIYNAHNATFNLVSSARVDSATSAVADAVSLEEGTCEAMGYTNEVLSNVRCYIYSMITPEDLLTLRTEPNLDPMATLIAAGSDIVSDSITGFVAGFVMIAGGSIVNMVLPGMGGLIQAAGHLAILLGFVGFAAGMILFYALPLFPFIYFFFAVVSWIMEIFEAVVAMPLWALAHLRIDGDGMPGQAAANGYFLLLAILLRPSLIIFGLLGGYVIFGAGVYLLQILFDPLLGVVHNDRMYGFDLLIYTVIYAFICYSLAMMCFKLVDEIPNQIIRWLGSGAQTFSEGRPEDPVRGSTAGAIAAVSVAQQGMGTITSGAENAGKGLYGMTPQGRRETAAQMRAQEGQQNYWSQFAGGATGGDNPAGNTGGGNPTGGGGGSGGGGGGGSGSGFSRYDPQDRDNFKGPSIDNDPNDGKK